MLASIQQLLDYAAAAEGQRRRRLLSAAGVALQAIPFDNPEVQDAALRRAELLQSNESEGAPQAAPSVATER